MFNYYHPVPKAAQNFRNLVLAALSYMAIVITAWSRCLHISYLILYKFMDCRAIYGKYFACLFLITKFAKTSDPLLIKKHYNIKLKSQRFLKAQTALHSSKHENFFKSTINSQTFPLSLIKPTDVCRELCYCRNIVPTPSLLVLHIQS